MSKIVKKLEKKINNLIQINKEYPKQLEITEVEYKELVEAEGKMNKFRGCELIVKKEVRK